jgi:hypothetical protein
MTPTAVPFGMPPLGAPQIGGIGVPALATIAKLAVPTRQLKALPSSGTVPLEPLTQSLPLKVDTVGVQDPGVALQLQGVQPRWSLIAPKIEVLWEKPPGQLRSPVCHTHTELAVGTHMPPLHAPLTAPGPHACAYLLKLAAGVGFATEPMQFAPIAVVGLPSMAAAAIGVHDVETACCVLLPLQLSWPNTFTLTCVGHVPFVTEGQLHDVQLMGDETVVPPATPLSGFGHAPGHPMEGLVPVSRMTGPDHPAGMDGAQVPAQTTPLDDAALLEDATLLDDATLLEDATLLDDDAPLDEVPLADVAIDEVELAEAPPSPELPEVLLDVVTPPPTPPAPPVLDDPPPDPAARAPVLDVWEPLLVPPPP